MVSLSIVDTWSFVRDVHLDILVISSLPGDKTDRYSRVAVLYKGFRTQYFLSRKRELLQIA